jgi:hypothetical protein
MSSLRTRWAALGAAVAVTLGAGGIGLVSATNPAGVRTFIPITPCRVIDTRPAPDNVGPKSSPLGPAETHTVTIHGTNGDCTGIPTTAKAVSLNVTAVGATQPTFLTLWATGQSRPLASSLNPTPGQPPTPNAVTTNVDTSGRFNIYNLQGNVHVLADINGYYADHNHDDRYYTKAQADAALDLRAPETGSIALAGGAFAPRQGELDWQSGTSCFSNSTPANGIRHSIPLESGVTITHIEVRTRAGANPDTATLTLFAQRPGTTDGTTVESFTLATTALGVNEAVLELAVPETIDPGEALYLAFAGSGTSFLCSATVRFQRLG